MIYLREGEMTFLPLTGICIMKGLSTHILAVSVSEDFKERHSDNALALRVPAAFPLQFYCFP